MKIKAIISGIYDKLLSPEAKKRVEQIVYVAAIVGFFAHLLAIGLIHIGQLDVEGTWRGLRSPIDAIYTPFSILLFYEIYCLIYYLPKSITIFIGKQFEIITLITIREIFSEMAALTISSDVQALFANPQFIYSMVTILVLFLLIYLFYGQNQSRIRMDNHEPSKAGFFEDRSKYVLAKHTLSLFMGIVFVVLAAVSIWQWIAHSGSFVEYVQNTRPSTKAFFESFFMILILNDVLVLLLSFAVTHEFHKVIRNSGFVISTTLIKMSFAVKGLASHILIVMGVLFGVLVLVLYNKYEAIELPED